MGDKRVVLWIDENQRALDTYAPFLEECFGGEVIVIPEMPEKELPVMLDRIFHEQNLISLVIDQRLKSTGKATYSGIELAEAVRRLDKKIPVYILTNYAEDIGDLEYQVEAVLEKDHLPDETYQRKIAARIRRHADVFDDIVSAREMRFDELLCKSLQSELTAEERDEFEKLDFWRNKEIVATEETFAEKLKQELDKQQKELDEVRKEIESLQGGKK